MAARPGDMSQQALCNALWALGVLQAADVHVVRALGMELEQRLQGGGQHRAVDYSQVFHAGMMMDLQWKVRAARRAAARRDPSRRSIEAIRIASRSAADINDASGCSAATHVTLCTTSLTSSP